jgi:uncharacterized membrane protein
MFFLQLVDVVFFFCVGLLAIWGVVALMLKFWKVTAGLGLIILVALCIAEPRVFYAGAVAIPVGWLGGTLATRLAEFVFDDKKKA